MSKLKHYSRLLPGVSQFEVDFVIPRLGSDIPLGIDPFLMYKSRDLDLSRHHSLLLDAFNSGVHLIRDNKFREAEALLKFPEVPEIGLGYAQTTKRGSGVGEYLGSLIIKSLVASPAFLNRGLKHIEEMQLISVGIGADRISDTAANILKLPLIEYTQKQCSLWNLPLTKDVPVQNVFDPEKGKWFDGYFDLPLSPLNQESMIFVPRRIVRALPWINYDDYFRSEFSPFLRTARRGRTSRTLQATRKSSVPARDKEEIVTLSQKDLERVERYVAKKELMAAEAQPSSLYLDADLICSEAARLKENLAAIEPGQKDAQAFQYLVLEILNFLFNPELIDGKTEIRTIDGTERRDIIFTNDSDLSFWDYVRNEHSSLFLMFETKNSTTVTNDYLNQTATYMGDRIGRLAFLVSRTQLHEPQIKKAYSIYNDSTPRKIIIGLSDSDLRMMLDMKCKRNNPMRHIQNSYRTFRTSVQ